MRPSRFALFVLIDAVALALLVAGFNAGVDPYLVFGAPRVAGWNALKPAAATQERIMKAYDAPRRPARTVILGSSRTDIGMDPHSTVWPAASQPVYNMSLVGSGLDTSLRYLRHVVASRPAADAPRTVIVGLDFESFLYRPVTARTDAAAAGPSELERRLLVRDDGSANPDRPLQYLKDAGAALLSLDAFTDSASTVLANRRGGGIDVGSDGHYSDAALRETTAADGVSALFEQKNAITRADFTVPHRVLSDTPDGEIRELPLVRDLIHYAHKHNIELLLAIQPNHASRLDLLNELGYWPDYERWKRALTALTESERAGGSKVTLWDFGGYEAYSRETIPPPGNRSIRLQWFWDPVHSTPALGDLMIARILNKPGAAPYGVVLTPQTIDARLTEIRAARQAATMASR